MPDDKVTERPRTVPRARGEGQWALGYREPLNPAEVAKKEDDGLNVRARIEGTYAKKGFASIWPSDLRNRFRWYGLYTQRPEVDGYFMMRIRIPGGILTSAQTELIGEISEVYGRDVADITDRQNVQLHWIRIEDVPEIWARLEAAGLSTTEACGDTPRNILGCPLAGIDAAELIDASALVKEVDRALVGDLAFSNLPRKYKISISGCAHQCSQHEINDVGLVGTLDEAGAPGFDLWVGGGLSTNPMFGQRLGVFVTPEHVTPVVVGVTEIFRDWGYRRARNRARLKFLMRDWGPEKFREMLEKQIGFALPSLTEPPPSITTHREHIGVWPQKDGLNYIGFAPKAGRIAGHQLKMIARLAERYGNGRIRTTTQQKLVVLDVATDDVEALASELAALDLPVDASNWRKGTMACTGIEFCKLAIVETKGRAVELYRYLEARLPGASEEVRINVNGCPNSCARYQTADIGLMGCQVNQTVFVVDHDGEQIEERRKVEAFLVHLGGHLGDERTFGRKVKGVKVLGSELGPYVETLIRRYRTGRAEGEGFSAYVNRLDPKAFIAFAAKPVFEGLPPAPSAIAEPRAS
ncbi:MAG TPA: nitrite/sulfite reductase [Actinomycetota bacterium]|nr:nitrite/sulfite reductase [Actinomycetota bacterium]